MSFGKMKNKFLLRILLVIIVCMSTLMLMVTFKVAVSNQFSIADQRKSPVHISESSSFNSPKFLFHKRSSVREMQSRKRTTILMRFNATSRVTPMIANLTGSNNSTSSPLVVFDYPYIIEEPDICELQRPDIFVLIYVHTAPDHFRYRAVIRRTWGNSKLYKRLRAVTLFFVGRSTDVNVNNAMAMESERYGDIIQADFVDSYRNLSVKAVVALRWIVEHCGVGRPTFIVKVDDDMFVNVFNLVRHLHYLHRYNDLDSSDQRISCLVWHSMTVLRDHKSKWYVSKDEYGDERYPTYCSGSAFFMATQVIERLYNASMIAPFLWVDDVYATGILAKLAGVQHTSINSIVTLSASKYDSQLIEGEAVFGHMTGNAGVDLRYQYWTKVVEKEKSAVDFPVGTDRP